MSLQLYSITKTQTPLLEVPMILIFFYFFFCTYLFDIFIADIKANDAF